MKSILFFGNYLHFSGAFEVFRNIARELKKQGIRTAYLFHRHRDGDTVPDLSMFDEVHYKPDDEGAGRDDYGRQLADIANTYDVCHSSLLPMQWRFAFKKRLDVPLVETYHSPDGWRRIWPQYEIRLREGVESPPAATIAVSDGLCEMIQKTGIRAERIYNGVLTPDVPIADGPYVTYCGRIAHDKGLDDWIRVARRVRDTLPHAKFQWIGKLSPVYDDFAFRCIQAACPWLEVTGFTNDPAPYYQRSAVLLMTSPSEGLPMVILEAMMHGVPTVALDTGDIRETNADLVHNLSAAERRVCHWLTCGCKKWRTELQTQARAMFSAEAMANSYLEVYKRCIALHV